MGRDPDLGGLRHVLGTCHCCGALGHRQTDPRHAAGDWHPTRDEPAAPAWPGGKRPPLRTNLPKETTP